MALDFATSAYETAQTAVPPVASWLLASTQEGMARAYACAGRDDERDRFAADARRTLDTVEDAEDGDLIAGQLATIPGLPDA